MTWVANLGNDIERARVEDHEGRTVAVLVGDGDITNVFRMAAASDLYDALKLLAYRFEDHLAGKPVRDADEALGAAHIALAKARGEP